MAEDRSGIRSRLLGAIISPAVDAVDVDDVVDRVDVEHVVERIDIDGVVQRIDLNAALDRIDFNTVLAEIDLDPILQRIDLDALLANADVNALIERVDVNLLAERVDLNALLARVDVNALATRIDLNALLTNVDVDALAERVDVNAIVERVDVNALATKLDLDTLVSKVDVNALLAKVDVDALAGRVDVNAIVGRVDIDAVVDAIDIEDVVSRAGIDKIVAEASTGVVAHTLDLVRRQLVGVDLVLFTLIDRVLRREREEVPAGPLSASQRPAGPVSRLLAFLADSALVSALFGLGVSLGLAAMNLFVGNPSVGDGERGWIWLSSLAVWWFLYLWASVAIAGRTPGKALLGLRVIDRDGTPLSGRRSAVRTLAFPVSFLLGIGFAIGLVRRDHRSLHDLVAGSQEIIDWGDREARMPTALERWVQRHDTGEVEPEKTEWAKPAAGS